MKLNKKKWRQFKISVAHASIDRFENVDVFKLVAIFCLELYPYNFLCKVKHQYVKSE